MGKLLVHDITKRLSGVYLKISGTEVTCTLPAPEREFSEKEMEILGEAADGVVILFEKTKFKWIGYDGNWYRVITMPPVRDFDTALCVENLDELGLIEKMGKMPGSITLASFKY